MQTKLESFLESSLNILSGMITALVTQILVFPLFDIQVSMHTNVQIMLIFTGVSLLRSYIWRRLFNHRTIKKYGHLLKESEDA